VTYDCLIFYYSCCSCCAVNPIVKLEALNGLLDHDKINDLLTDLRQKRIKEPLFLPLRSLDGKRFFFGRQTELDERRSARADMAYRDDFLTRAEEILEPLHQTILKRLPTHTVMSVSILVSLPGACEQKLHTDFDVSTLHDMPICEYPFSVIIPLHDFCELIVKDDLPYPTTLRVPYNYYLHFRGDVIHAGGNNTLIMEHYRIHAYFSPPYYSMPFDTFYVCI